MKQTMTKISIRFYGYKTLIVSGLLIIYLLVTGCEEESYHTFDRSFTGQQTLVYAINATGNTDLTGVISNRDVLKSLLGDASDRKYRSIDKISIKSMQIAVDKTANNTADSFRLLSITVKGLQAPVENEIASATNLSIGQGHVYAANLWLATGGVGKVNEVFNESLTGETKSLDLGSLGSVLPRNIAIRLRGTNVPSGSRASLTLKLIIDYTIEYTVCEKVPDLYFGPGDERECNF
ncbi:MAG: hypothetical protein LH609_05285 [Rudanella sp.]|nr:hypothetical protein [Rudanella sp.]